MAAMAMVGCSAATPTPAGSFVTYDPSFTIDGLGNMQVGAYGSSFNMDGLGNMQVGGPDSGAPNTSVSVRFRAEQSGALTAFRAYWLGADYAGYGGGTGGTIRASIRTDNGGVPSSTVLAFVDHVRPSALFPLLKFSSPATVTAGNVYHLVFTNIDPDPVENFSSINLSWVSGSVLSPRQPNTPDADYAALRRFGTDPWSLEGQYTPIIDLTYGNGLHQGKGYMEVEHPTPAIIAGTSEMVRERFTVSGGSRTVTGAAVRLARTSGSGDLTVRLEDASGTVIDSFTVPASSIPSLSASGDPSGVWVSGKFSTPHTLTDGATYHLRLSTDDSTSLWTRGIQQGDAYDFKPATYFADGFLQVSTDGGSSWSTAPELGASGDLQFFLQ